MLFYLMQFLIKYLKILITSNLIPLFKMKINIVFDLQPKKKLKKIKIRNNIKIVLIIQKQVRKNKKIASIQEKIMKKIKIKLIIKYKSILINKIN